MADDIKINGGRYRWQNTGDGYVTVFDVPIVAEFAKGQHGVKYEGDKAALQEMVDSAQRRYNDGAFCATLYKRHNPDIPLTHPDFTGFALPTRVGTAKTQNGEKLAVFGNLKMLDEKFEEARAGKLPYISPEIPLSQKKIAGVALLDTLPPHNEFPLFTIGEEVKDGVAKFAANPEPKYEEPMPKDFSKDYPETDTLLKGMAASVEKIVKTFDTSHQKPDPLPVEPKGDAKMGMDAETAAKFAAMANDNAEFKAKFAAQDKAEKVRALMAKADAALTGKIIAQAVRDSVIAKFAADATDMKDGEAWFTKMLDDLKPSLKDKPTIGGAGGQTVVNPADPVVAKFVKDGQDIDAVAKFSAQYDALEARGFWERGALDGNKCSKEFFIKNELSLAKSKAREAKNENWR